MTRSGRSRSCRVSFARWTFDRAQMRAAITDDMFATDRALAAAVAGVPFRDAYRKIAATSGGDAWTPESSLAARVSPGRVPRSA